VESYNLSRANIETCLKKDFFFFFFYLKKKKNKWILKIELIEKKNMDPSDRLPRTVRTRELKRNRKFALRSERRLSFEISDNTTDHIYHIPKN
jgi:hypothetical protein